MSPLGLFRHLSPHVPILRYGLVGLIAATLELYGAGNDLKQTVAAGAKVTLTVSADGTPAPTFQWQKNGINIAGATGSTYTLNSTTLADAGIYTAVATNSVGTATGNNVELVVNSPATAVAPVITTQPASQSVSSGGSVTFTAAASGTPAPTFQWRKNGSNINSATNASFTLASTGTTDAGVYDVIATNSVGSVTSSGATLAVTAPSTNVAPAITSQPSPATVPQGATATFSAAASGMPAPTYQWYKNWAAIPGATDAALTLKSVTSSDEGIYFASATNIAGSVSSWAQPLTVSGSGPVASVAPSITTQPVSQAVNSGANVAFTVAASGTPAPTYQWFKNGAAISGATNVTLSLNGVATSDAATYYVVATNSASSVTSNSVTLTLNAPVSSTPTPTPTPAPTPTPTTPAPTPTPTPAPAAPPPVTAPIVIAPVLPPTAVAPTTSQPPASAAPSNPATLPVAIAPKFSVQPSAQTVSAASSVTLTAVASGTPAPSYQWYKNGVPLNGGTSASLTLSSASSNDAATYTVVASNFAGSVTSNNAVLTVNPAVAPVITIQSAGQTGDERGNTGGTTGGQANNPINNDSRLTNLSVRSVAGNGNASLIVGFVVSGTSAKPLLVRGIGPALDTFGISGALQDPSLSLYSGSALLGTNDDWSTSGDTSKIVSTSASVGAFRLAPASRDAVMLTSLPSGAYTAQVGGRAATSGVALVELYDTAADTSARLVNVSVRTIAGPGANAPIIGFVVAGNAPKKLLVRAVGPGLQAFGVSGVLADPQLEIFHDAERVDQNDNWSGDAALSEAFARVGAFAITDASSKDAALLFTAAPGAYTAVVSGRNDTSGIVIVEIYEMP